MSTLTKSFNGEDEREQPIIGRIGNEFFPVDVFVSRRDNNITANDTPMGTIKRVNPTFEVSILTPGEISIESGDIVDSASIFNSQRTLTLLGVGVGVIDVSDNGSYDIDLIAQKITIEGR